MWAVPTDLSPHQTCRHDLFLLNDIVLLYIHASFAAAEGEPTLPQDAWVHPDANGEKCAWCACAYTCVRVHDVRGHAVQ